jgi:ATP-binding cassette subfamily B protein
MPQVTLRFFLYYYRRFKKHFWLGISMLLITDLLDVIPPLILKQGIDQATERAGADALLKTGITFAVLVTGLAFVRYLWRLHFGRFHQNVARDLRNRLFEKLTVLGPSFYQKNPTGELMSLLNNDIEAIRMGIGPGLLVLTDALFYFLTIPPIMIWISPGLTWKTLILMPFLPVFVNWLGNIVNKRFEKVQELFSRMSGVTQENISGIRTVKSYAQEKNQIDYFNSISAQWRDASLAEARADSWMHPVMEFCVTVGVVALLIWGSRDVLSGALTVGSFVAFHRYIIRMVWPMTAVGWGASLVQQGRASLKRVQEFLETEVEVPSPTQGLAGLPPVTSPEALEGPIEFRDLSFTYPETTRPVLQNISLTIQPGESLGIVGTVGCGKTTLVNLLCHLFEVERGQIFVNGHDIRDIDLRTLRQHITLVPQETFLFSEKIAENMAFGSEVALEAAALKRAAQTARIEQEIEKLPEGYNTYLGERGVNLSGGQKQRLTITRALLRRSPVIVFDDSLSAVDAETEALILKRLRQDTENLTTIIISHRLTSLALCDRIAVLKDGRIEAIAAPGMLARISSTYRDLLSLQTSGSEARP